MADNKLEFNSTPDVDEEKNDKPTTSDTKSPKTTNEKRVAKAEAMTPEKDVIPADLLAQNEPVVEPDRIDPDTVLHGAAPVSVVAEVLHQETQPATTSEGGTKKSKASKSRGIERFDKARPDDEVEEIDEDDTDEDAPTGPRGADELLEIILENPALVNEPHAIYDYEKSRGVKNPRPWSAPFYVLMNEIRARQPKS